MKHEQRGVAVVVAVLIVALATSTASYILWHQSLWVRQVENLTLRAQAETLTRAAAHWAAAILAADNAAVDHLGEAWARRMPAFGAESGQLIGVIGDEQAKLNVNNLARGGGPATRDVLAFQRLFASLGISGALTATLIDWLDEDDGVTQPNGAEDQYYLALEPPYRAANRRAVDLSELARVKGFTVETVARLAPYVTALPIETAVNVNTAPAAVLQAAIPSLSASDAARLVENRTRQPFASRDEFLRALPGGSATPVDAQIDVKSRFFSAEATVQIARMVTGYRVLLDRGEQNRPRIAMLSQLPS
jgi:general secretion pathway protein K